MPEAIRAIEGDNHAITLVARAIRETLNENEVFQAVHLASVGERIVEQYFNEQGTVEVLYNAIVEMRGVIEVAHKQLPHCTIL